MMHHHPIFDDDHEDDASDAGWDANGSPVAEPSYPIHPLRREQTDVPHACWICQRTTARTLNHDWLLAAVWNGQPMTRGGVIVHRWVCCSVCQWMALALLDGMLTLTDPPPSDVAAA